MHLQHPHPQEHKASLKQKHVDRVYFFLADYRLVAAAQKSTLNIHFGIVHTCGEEQRKI